MFGIEKTKAGAGSSLSALQGTAKSASGGQSFDEVLAHIQASAAEQANGTSASKVDEAAAFNDYRDNLKQLRERLEKLLDSLGIDTTGMPLKLQVNPGGQVGVSGEHPGREALQNAINQDPQLVALFGAAAKQGEDLAESEKPSLALPGVQQWKERFSLEIDGITQTPVLE